MDPSTRPLPPWLRAVNAAAARLSQGADPWQPERLLLAAGRTAGLAPEFPPHVREALEVLCRSLREECQHHFLGVMNTQTLLLTGLAALLRIEHRFAADPALAATPLRAPLVITGLPRSGTTFLHRLLSAAPDAVGVPLHRHLMPVAHGALDLRRVEAEIKFYPWKAASRVYGLDAIHLVRPGLPDECNFGMRLAGRSMIYWANNPIHGYLRWLLAQDLRESYQLYRKVLILHQRDNPGRRLILKCPHHLARLPALTEALPEAMIVETHRDPVEVVPSECKLILSLQGIAVRALDPPKTVASNSFKVRTYAERAVAFARGPQRERVQHVDYRRLVVDPVGVARDLHHGVGLPFSAAHEAALSRYATENRQHKHGRNHYQATDFGLDPRTIAREFAEYRECFLSTPAEGALNG